MSDQQDRDKGQGSRPESDGPDKSKPPAKRGPADTPSSPEKTPDVHGHPEPPS